MNPFFIGRKTVSSLSMKNWRDHWQFIRKLSIQKIWNVLVVWVSFYIAKAIKSTRHPGMPISMSIEPTTACNLGCPECPSGLKAFTRPTGNLKPVDFQRWISELAPTLTYINFYFQGEPYIHPQLLDMVSFASQKKIYTATSTNAHFISDQIAKKTVESGLDRLIISVDGTTQEVYEQYRIHGKLSQVIEGTKRLVEWKEKLNSSTPHLIFQFLVVKPNEHQMDDARKLAAELGVNEIRFKTAQVYEYEKGHPLLPEDESYSRYKKQADGTYVLKNKMDNHCWRMWTGSVITWDGRVVPCCFDKDASHAMGSLSEHSFQTIWNSTAYQNFRRSLFRSRKEIDICSNCSEGTKVWA
jgi:radical SAM protein with 4Fe4S-binding SPASM domain